jgi:hypothetical protein
VKPPWHDWGRAIGNGREPERYARFSFYLFMRRRSGSRVDEVIEPLEDAKRGNGLTGGSGI